MYITVIKLFYDIIMTIHDRRAISTQTNKKKRSNRKKTHQLEKSNTVKISIDRPGGITTCHRTMIKAYSDRKMSTL